MFRNKPQFAGALVGLVVTGLSALLFFAVLDERMELQAFDMRVQWCNTIEPSDSIVHVDIDDSSVERVGRWPWRRDQHADTLRVLNELGAKYIMVDLLLSEPEEPYIDNPALSKDADIEGDVEVTGEISEQNLILGDLELADAIRNSGNVLMAVQLDVTAPDAPEPFLRWIRRRWRDNQEMTVGDAIRAFGLENTPVQRLRVRRELLRLRATDELLRDFTLTDRQLADRLDADLLEVTAVVAGVKREVAYRLVEQHFDRGEIPSFENVAAAILGKHRDRHTADREDVKGAYRAQLGLMELKKAYHPLSPDVASHLNRAYNAVPLDYRLAKAASDIASVNFEADIDGTVRRVPILIDYKGVAVKHLGFAAAVHILGLDPDRITMPHPRLMVIPYRDGSKSLEIPLDGRGNLIIPWAGTAQDWRTGGDFPHISVAKIWSLVSARREIKENETRINYLLADVIAASKGTVKKTIGEGDKAKTTDHYGDSPFRENVNKLIGMEREIHLAGLLGNRSQDEIEALKQNYREFLAHIKLEQNNAISNVELSCQELDTFTPEELAEDPELNALADRFRSARELLRGKYVELQQANALLAETADRLKKQLTAAIQGKYVFLGFAATAQGDIVSTPIDPRTNGVMCHAHVLNGFLQNRFISRAGHWREVMVCLLLGMAAGTITATRGPKIALVSSVLLIAAFVLFNGRALFQGLDSWFALVAIVVTIFLAWAFVTLFRQFTAERDKRLFRKQLSQYTSPAIAEKIAESPNAAQAFKTVQTRDITCFFTDLAGFTSITETEDAEVVQHVLNTYLERMSQVIWSHRGLINKFMGDGIMAFFNPSVDPLPQHPRVACETAIAMFDALERLKREQNGTLGADVFRQLEMRVGIATGLCANGDMGSELKADYTVIGDVVNLAARLEPANKVFGTQVMVSHSVREAVLNDYEFRHLAALQVKGKAQTVPVYEVVCRKGELSDEQRDYIERFEAGITLYQERKWDDCIVHFTRMLTRHAGDAGASRYIAACQEFKTFPPADDWNGALELKEK